MFSALFFFFFLPCLQVSYTIVNSNFCLYVNYFLIALLFLIICWSHSRHISIFVFYNLCFSYIFLGIKWLFFFLLLYQYLSFSLVELKNSISCAKLCSKGDHDPAQTSVLCVLEKVDLWLSSVPVFQPIQHFLTMLISVSYVPDLPVVTAFIKSQNLIKKIMTALSWCGQSSVFVNLTSSAGIRYCSLPAITF